MKSRILGLLPVGLLLGNLASFSAYATSSVTLGEQDFTNGQTSLSSPDFNNAGANEAAPFNVFNGADLNGPNFTASFTFAFAPDSYSAANLTLGLFDHDSAATGDQVASFLLDGVDLTAALNALLNSYGGNQTEYNVYTLSLAGLGLAALADGSATFSLSLQGPGLGFCDNPSAGLCPFDGAGLDFATLTLNPVPEPGTLALLGLGLAGLGLSRRRKAN